MTVQRFKTSKNFSVASADRQGASTDPSLVLDFANARTLDSRITFTRGSTARYYDGRTVAKAEENLVVGSENFRDTGTTFVPLNLVSSIAVNDIDTAPNGTTTADTLIATTTNAGHRVRYPVFSADTYTFSVFVKPNGLNYVALSASDATTNAIVFNITSGSESVQSTNGNATNGAITQSTNGYWRISATIPLSTNGIYIVLMSNSTTSVFAGNNTDGIYVWGAQLEQRSAVTAYTATTTQPITNYIPVLQTAGSGSARFDHNPVTGESLGLLIEEQRTNLLAYSEDFANAAWIKTRSSIASNTIVAPDGTLTGDKHIPTTENNANHWINVNNLTVTSTQYTFTIFAKKAEIDFLTLGIVDSGSFTKTVRQNFNLSAGTVGTKSEVGGYTVSSASLVSVGNGWYRCILVTSALDANSTTRLEIQSRSNDATTSYTGDGYSGVYIWGAQLEAGAFPTSYIPTVAATETRNADVATMTGTNFTSWYRADEGTLYADGVLPYTVPATQFPAFAVISDGTENNRFTFGYFTSGLSGLVLRLNNVNVVELYPLTTAANRKFGAAYKTGDFGAAVNGGVVSTSSLGTLIPAFNQMTIGARGTTANTTMNGHIRKIAYYPKRLTNAELQTLTRN